MRRTSRMKSGVLLPRGAALLHASGRRSCAAKNRRRVAPSRPACYRPGMSVFGRYKDAFVQGIALALGSPAAEIAAQVKDAEPAHGDLSFPTFALAKQQKKAPPVMAKELVAKLALEGMTVTAVGPYV